jgi:3-hydroxyacyl-CoA dehydrogenase/enoyl-CoA hydratase/3-hydroxybutyryl-CoA epimerase
MKKITKNKIFKFEINQLGIAIIYIKIPGDINKINSIFISDFCESVQLIKNNNNIKAAILISKNKNFCMGIDFDIIKQNNKNFMTKEINKFNEHIRILENCNKTIVAAINGSATSTGYELTLGCNYRIGIKNDKSYFGLPDIRFGILPSSGSMQRLSRIIGIQETIKHILTGSLFSLKTMYNLGIINKIVKTEKDMLYYSKLYIQKNLKSKQPWDNYHKEKIFKTQINDINLNNILLSTIAMIYKKTSGSQLAPQLAISAIQEGLQINFEQSLQVEFRYFLQSIMSKQTQAMIQTLWHHKNLAIKLDKLPKCSNSKISTVGIIGAGMMGSGIAVLCIKAGYKVSLIDIKQTAINNALTHCKKYLTVEEIKNLQCFINIHDMTYNDLVIEAVFEDITLKQQIIKKINAKITKHVILASNTSTLPITELAKFSSNNSNFIGMHFFSPAEKMKLIEIIKGKHTSKHTLARSLHFARSINKLPIVVNDGYGFFTSRVFFSYVLEAIQLVSEGHHPLLIEWSAKNLGMAVGPLQIADEVSLLLIYKAILYKKNKFITKDNEQGFILLQDMINKYNRFGKSYNKGFYSYNNKKRILWNNLKNLITISPKETGIKFLQERIILLQCAEVSRIIDDKILNNYRDAELGSIFGLGFAPQIGGPLHYMDTIGINNIIIKLKKLEKSFGIRYKPARILYTLLKNKKTFF